LFAPASWSAAVFRRFYFRNSTGSGSALCCLLGLLIPLSAAHAAEDKPAPSQAIAIAKVAKKVDFDRDILPVFRQNCLACHNRTTTKAGVILETPEDILKGGDNGKILSPKRGASSLLLQVSAHQKDPVMPPPGNKASAANLTPDQLGLLKAWIDQGAKGEVRREVAIAWQPLPTGLNPILAVAVSPDGQFAAAARANQIHIYHLPTARLVERLNDPALQKSGLYTSPGVAHRDMVYSLAFSPDGSMLVSGSYREVKLWQRPVNPLKHHFNDHGAEAAQCAAVSPDGKWLASGHANGQVRVLDLATGKSAKSLSAHKGGIVALRFSPDGARLASLGNDQSLQLWDAIKWKSSLRVDGLAGQRALTWSTDGARLFTGGEDKLIRVWSLTNAPQPSLSQVAELKGHDAAVTALESVASTNQWIISASLDGTARLWDLGSNAVVRTFTNAGPVLSLAVRPDGQRLAAAGTNQFARIWSVADGKQLAEVKGDHWLREKVSEEERALAVAADHFTFATNRVTAMEKELAAAGERLKKANEALAAADKAFNDKKKPFDDAAAAKAAADKELAELEAPLKPLQAVHEAAQKEAQETDAALQVAKSKTGAENQSLAGTLAAELAAKNKAVADAKAALDKLAAELQPKLQPARDKAANTEKERVAKENEFKVAERNRSVADNERQLATKAEEAAKTALESAKEAVTAAGDGKAAAEKDLAAAKQAAADSEKPVRTVAFLADNLTLATAGADGMARTWHADTGAAFQNYNGHGSAVTTLTTGGGWLVSIGEEGSMGVWETARGWVLKQTIGGGTGSPFIDRVNAIAFSPEGKVFATGGGEPSRDGEIKLWNAADGSLVNGFRGVHSDAVLALEFSPDGRYLASGAADRFAKVVDARKGTVVKAFEGHTHHVYGVAWRANGRTLASAGGDKTVKLWNFVTGERIRNVEGYSKEVTAIRFLANTDQMLTTAGDNRVRLINEGGGEVKNLGAADYMQACAATPDGKVIVAGGQDSVLLVWTDVNKEPLRFKPEPSPARTAQANPSGSRPQ
jgi:WD40 repeat protein